MVYVPAKLLWIETNIHIWLNGDDDDDEDEDEDEDDDDDDDDDMQQRITQRFKHVEL